MKVVLELQDQQSNIKKVTVRHDIVIGRGAECNLRLSAPQVSRRHCFLRITEEGAFVSDLDSSNGTYLNGNKLTSGQRYALDDGANFAVGPVKFIAHVRSEVAASEVLQVSVTDDRIEAEEAVEPSPETTSDSGEYLATVSRPVDEQNVMNLSVEQAGAAAEEDDPTADYVATSPSASGLFTAAGEIDAVPEGDDETTVADAAAVDSALTGAARPAEAGLLSVDEDEMLVIDDDDELPSAESLEPAASEDDDCEQELRDFLSGLD